MAFQGEVIDGAVSDAQILQLDRVLDVDPEIAQLEPDDTPFTTFSNKTGMGSRKCFSQLIQWIEDELPPRTTAIATAGASASATNTDISITAADYLYVRNNSMLYNERTGERFLVTDTVPSSGDLTGIIRRGIGSTGAAMTAADPIVIVGSAYPEGSGIGDLRQVKKVSKSNYAGIQKHAFGVNGTEENSKNYSGPPVAYQTKVNGIDFKKSVEYMNLLGAKSLDVSDPNKPTATMAGFLAHLTTNVTTVAGNLSEATWLQWLQNVTRYSRPGTSTKMILVSPLVAKVIATWPASKLQLATDDATSITKYGMMLRRWQTPVGKEVLIKTVEHWGDFAAASPGATKAKSLSQMALAIDPNAVKQRVFRSSRLQPDQQPKDLDAKWLQYFVEQSLQVTQERTCGVLYDVRGAGAAGAL